MSPSEQAAPEASELSGEESALDPAESLDAVLASLLQRLALVEDTEKGCHLLLEHALRRGAVERAVVAVREGDVIRGAGCGIPEDVLHEFLERSTEADSPFDDLLVAGTDAVIRHPGHFSQLHFDSYVVLPLPSPDGGAGGLLVAEGTDPTQLGSLPELLAGCGPTLCRILERELRRESERLEAIIGSVGDPILVTDVESKIILTNGEAERLFEPDPESASASQARRAVRANDTRVTSLLSEIVIRPEKRVTEIVELTDPEHGQEFPAEIVSTKITNRRGEVTAVVSVIHDLTQVVENRRLARELRALNESLEERIRLATEELEERNRRLEWQRRELQKASRLKSEFLASMSHELRTPINAMLGYTSLLREEIYGELSKKQERALQKIYNASQHLLALINDILDLSKIEAGKMPVTVEEVRIEPIVKELVQTVEPMVRDKPVALETELDDDLPLLTTDRTKVKQVLLNLITNAIKFTAEGEVRIRVFSAADEDRIRIEVEDTGIGIEKEKLESIFQDFRQVDQSSTRKYPGTGLGLSITNKLLTLLQGQIFVESEYGSGSTFSVEIPIHVEPDEADRPRPFADEPPTVG